MKEEEVIEIVRGKASLTPVGRACRDIIRCINAIDMEAFPFMTEHPIILCALESMVAKVNFWESPSLSELEEFWEELVASMKRNERIIRNFDRSALKNRKSVNDWTNSIIQRGGVVIERIWLGYSLKQNDFVVICSDRKELTKEISKMMDGRVKGYFWSFNFSVRYGWSLSFLIAAPCEDLDLMVDFQGLWCGDVSSGYGQSAICTDNRVRVGDGCLKREYCNFLLSDDCVLKADIPGGARSMGRGGV